MTSAADVAQGSDQALLTVRDLHVRFSLARKRTLHAVAGVSFDLHRGETLGIIGESGSGKSTLARAVMGIEKVASGTMDLAGLDLRRLPRGARRDLARRIQMIFQDPFEALDPHLTCHAAIAEPLLVQGSLSRRDITRRVDEALERVGLSAHHGRRHARELSGGQRQRVNIARALTLDPDILICDEAVSALDVSVQAEILNLLSDLQSDLGLAYLFISHDIGVVARVCHRIGVMYLGQLIETGVAERLIGAPSHPYTAALISAEPQALPSRLRTNERVILQGEMPSPVDPPAGCRFRSRCPYAQELCKTPPPDVPNAADGTAACHFAGQLSLARTVHGTTASTGAGAAISKEE